VKARTWPIGGASTQEGPCISLTAGTIARSRMQDD
jgi:hypothetical protein